MPIEIVARLESGQIGDLCWRTSRWLPLKNGHWIWKLITEKLGRLGGTPFHLDQVELLTTDKVFVPTSELNQARRQLVDELFDSAGELKPIAARPIVEQQINQLKTQVSNSAHQETSEVAIHLLVRTPEQLDAAIESATDVPLASITLDYLELYGLRPSIEKIRDAGIRPRVASPRILKPSEQNVIRFLTSLECDILVARADCCTTW